MVDKLNCGMKHLLVGLKVQQELPKHNMLDGDQVTKQKETCEHCILGKAKKLSFQSRNHTKKSILDYVHLDLWGATGTHQRWIQIFHIFH